MKRFKYESLPGGYNISLLEDEYRGPNHVLVILQTVDGRDLKEGQLLSPEVWPSMAATLKYARTYAKNMADIEGLPYEQPTFTFVNWNAAKHLHLSPEQQGAYNNRFQKRVSKLIAAVKPDKILICGDTAFNYLHPKVKHNKLKRGWYQKLVYRGVEKKIPTVLTVDWAKLLEFDGLNGNLLGFWCHHLAALLVGKCTYSIGKIDPIPKYVDTDKKFDALLKRLKATKRVAVDTETRSLGVYDNAIYMIQFCFEEEPEHGYVVPLDHPMTPLTDDQRKRWRSKLKAFFAGSRKFFDKPYRGDALPEGHKSLVVCDNKELPELLFFNGAFDLRILRTCLKIPVIPHYVYEIRAGEHLLDENANELKVFGTRSGGLAYTACYYGSDFYQTAPFSKGERDTCGSVPPDDKDLLRYCLPRGQDVLMSDGTRKPIESIEIGDLVVSYREGKTEAKPVTHKIVHSNKKRMVRIHHATGSMIVSEDHQVWSEDRQEYISAIEILEGEHVLVTK